MHFNGYQRWNHDPESDYSMQLPNAFGDLLFDSLKPNLLSLQSISIMSSLLSVILLQFLFNCVQVRVTRLP